VFRAVLLAGIPAALLAFATPSLVPASVAQEVDAEFTEEFLQDPEVIAQGREIWVDHCRLCHGARTAYPGKAPPLRPRRYTPEFVYHRTTYGFRDMPAWQDVYSEEERMAVTAYILSNRFSP
jgi:mono/diheme cytochrome c family protein